MTEPSNGPRYRGAAHFLDNAEECSIVADIFDALAEKASETILDEDQLRQARDWSILANQIIGSEETQQ